MKLTPMEFVRPCQLGSTYRIGEVAGFDEATCEMLREQGFAKLAKKTRARAAKSDNTGPESDGGGGSHDNQTAA